MAAFVPGSELAHRFYDQVVRSALHPTAHAAAFVGYGSDVLGFDTARSTDHGWGPRLHVFVEERDVAEARSRLEAALPETFGGWPTRYGWDAVPVQSHIAVCTVSGWLTSHLGFDASCGLRTVDWLSTPQQLLLEVTAGPAFHDDRGELTAVRKKLTWYPHDVWLWLLACQWRRLDQEEPLVGRTAEVGDELGSRILAARLVRDLMRLCLLIERRYAPYSKWLGSAFSRLTIADPLTPVLARALGAPAFPEREDALVEAFESVARHHNQSGVTGFVEPKAALFHSRPYRVLGSGRFSEACLAQVGDAWLRALPPFGGIDQIVDSTTDVLSSADRARRFAAIYGD